MSTSYTFLEKRFPVKCAVSTTTATIYIHIQ